ncbi:MBL fold metallo-hydrolase [Listeria grandensis]|uniref:MBL fold metallo-hydrolase n=1 Tax=Listeria grandensis TaxID=1494963 RepID=A0A7X0Y1D5_9LIST|nr:MBL fold metallo-hydrolase [Listeria grandensis]MBC1935220.1 MBL fold metallo-hydrolase [Listeria grandensis]
MIIHTIASGSKGNAYLIDDGRSQLLLECGIPFKKIREALGFNLTEVAGCLVSHEHGDHTAGVKKMLQETSIPLFASEGTIEALKIQDKQILKLVNKTPSAIATFRIMPFEVQHDAAEPLGFMIDSVKTKERLVFITDSYYVKYKFPKMNYLMIECNYASDILEDNVQSGRVHRAQKKRVLQSHFSLDNVKDFLRANDLSKLKEIHLLHISDSNGDPQRFKQEIQALTGIPVHIARSDKK